MVVVPMLEPRVKGYALLRLITPRPAGVIGHVWRMMHVKMSSFASVVSNRDIYEGRLLTSMQVDIRLTPVNVSKAKLVFDPQNSQIQQ